MATIIVTAIIVILSVFVGYAMGVARYKNEEE